MTDLAKDISSAVAVLRKGGIIVYPTDTVWGIGCDACNSEAVRRVFEIKRRADSKALITLVADGEDVARYTSSDFSAAMKLIGESRRPTTVIYPGAKGLAPELIADGRECGHQADFRGCLGCDMPRPWPSAGLYIGQYQRLPRRLVWRDFRGDPRCC